jgi:hypothetical protein
LALVLLILGSINEFSDARASFRTGFYPKNQRTAGEKNGIKGTPKQSRGIKRSAFLFGENGELLAAAAEFDLGSHASCQSFPVDVVG